VFWMSLSKHRADAALKGRGPLLLVIGAAGAFVEMALPLDIAGLTVVCRTTNLARAAFAQRFRFEI
jgi:hypothetical protein